MIPALGKKRQEDCQFEASLGHLVGKTKIGRPDVAGVEHWPTMCKALASCTNHWDGIP